MPWRPRRLWLVKVAICGFSWPFHQVSHRPPRPCHTRNERGTRSIVRQRLHQPERRFPYTVCIVINGGRDNRPARQQRLPGTFQGGELGSFEMKLQKCRKNSQRIERPCHDAPLARRRWLGRVTKSFVKKHRIFAVRENAVVNRDAGVMARPGLQIICEQRPIERVRLNGDDLLEAAFRLLDESFVRCHDGRRHPAGFLGRSEYRLLPE